MTINLLTDKVAQVLLVFGILWLGAAVVVAVEARRRQRSAVIYFLCSTLFSPILAIILLAISGGVVRPDLSQEGDD